MLKQCDMTDEARVFFDKIPEDKLITAQFMFWETGFSVPKCGFLITQFVMAGLLRELGNGFFQKNI
ncbi:hypothetical protein BBX45_10435 [Proteus mirabilis]|nr:hypothetical protein AM403_17840 [Proteus mirabilis]KXC00336.1 hypothetical protein HMPREF3203_02063 [Proteus mirabilis]MDC9734949.1 TrmB family transcriptional regulator [Proteus mirabilis]OAH92763.1 hypothetical protein AZH52_10145 [Proteus mirabilis]OHY48087.1 hypothetical protein BBX45_10435 [Proteus mirabilis]